MVARSKASTAICDPLGVAFRFQKNLGLVESLFFDFVCVVFDERADGGETIDVLKERWVDMCRHRVEDEVDALSASEFCCGDEVGVASDEDDCVDEPFEGERGDIDGYFHIDAFLADVHIEVVFGEVVDCYLAGEELLCRVGMDEPVSVVLEGTEAQGYLTFAAEGVEEGASECVFVGFAEIYGAVCYWVVEFFVEGFAVVVEYAVESVAACESESHIVEAVGDIFRRECALFVVEGVEAFEEEAAVDEYGDFGWRQLVLVLSFVFHYC